MQVTMDLICSKVRWALARGAECSPESCSAVLSELGAHGHDLSLQFPRLQASQRRPQPPAVTDFEVSGPNFLSFRHPAIRRNDGSFDMASQRNRASCFELSNLRFSSPLLMLQRQDAPAGRTTTSRPATMVECFQKAILALSPLLYPSN